MDHVKAFDEYFDAATLESLSKTLKTLLEDLADRNSTGHRIIPRELQTRLQAIFSAFDSELNEINPRQTVVNFIKLGYLELAYYWNLSRKSALTGTLNWNSAFDSYRQVSEWVINAVLIQDVPSTRSELQAIDDRFGNLTGLGGDL